MLSWILIKELKESDFWPEALRAIALDTIQERYSVPE